MNLSLLKDLEIYNQTYVFDYNCLEANSDLLYQLRTFLNSCNIDKTIPELRKFYINGALYKLSTEELESHCKSILNIPLESLPAQYTRLNYFTAWGSAQTSLDNLKFKKEFDLYINALASFLKDEILYFNPEDLNLLVFYRSFFILMERQPKKLIDFNNYIDLISINEFQKLEVLLNIDKQSLNNPLIYQWILYSNALSQRYATNEFSKLLIEQIMSLWSSIPKKIAS